MTWLDLLAATALRGTVVLAAAFAANALAGRASAALRHFLWTAAFAALLLMPAVISVAPQWSWRAAPSTLVAANSAAIALTAPAGRVQAPIAAPAPRAEWLIPLWSFGCLLAAARFLTGAVRTSWIVRAARPAPYARQFAPCLSRALGIRRPVRVLETAAAPAPMAWGFFRPVILLPERAGEWSRERLETVLLHELVHVRRFDLLCQVVAQSACSLFWFHPLVWLAARRLVKEREHACDDAVLLRGVPAHDYAGHILDLVRAMIATRSPFPDVPAMESSSELEARVRALLDRGRNRRPLSRRAVLAVTAMTAAVLLPAAVVTAQAQAPRGALAGIVQDASGARVPQCEVVAANLDGPNQEIVRTNDAGEYRFLSIPAGRYSLEFHARGFTLLKGEAVVAPGSLAQFDAAMQIGSVKESMVITGSRPAGIPPRPAAVPQRIRVGGQVQATKLIAMSHPAYPQELQQQGITGTVVMRAVISTTGDLANLEVVNTDVHPGLAQAALDAVRKWRYQPTLLNGQPVEVVTTITLDFQLQ